MPILTKWGWRYTERTATRDRHGGQNVATTYRVDVGEMESFSAKLMRKP